MKYFSSIDDEISSKNYYNPRKKGIGVGTRDSRDRLSLHPKAHFRHQHWQIGLRANNVAAEILPEDAPVPLWPDNAKFCPKFMKPFLDSHLNEYNPKNILLKLVSNKIEGTLILKLALV